jgi:acetate CoA/acetoacetate CoA-transferase beta subunit
MTRRGLVSASANSLRPAASPRVIASHIGTNPETQRLMLAGQLAVELVPQGTLAERIRAGGAGLGGVLTATGMAAEGRQVVQVDGREFLVEPALNADVALVAARGADYAGNLVYSLTARNFNPLMAMAADTVIAEANEIVSRCVGSGCCPHAGRADRPSDRATAGGVTSRTRGVVDMNPKELIARRVARELRDNTLVNLGIGLPTMVAQFVPAGTKVYFQSENGIIGFGARPPEGMEDLHLTDAGRAFVSALPGAVAFDSAMSFALIRGGHLDMTVLGGLQVDGRGRLANWFIPETLVPGMGGAMDLVSGARRVIVAMNHTQKGTPKIVDELTLPATSLRPVTLVVTDLAVIEPTPEGLVLRERTPGVSVEAVRAATGSELLLSATVPEMDLS